MATIYTEDVMETLEKAQPSENLAKVKKPRTEKQIAALKKAQEARAAKKAAAATVIVVRCVNLERRKSKKTSQRVQALKKKILRAQKKHQWKKTQSQ